MDLEKKIKRTSRLENWFLASMITFGIAAVGSLAYNQIISDRYKNKLEEYDNLTKLKELNDKGYIIDDSYLEKLKELEDDSEIKEYQKKNNFASNIYIPSIFLAIISGISYESKKNLLKTKRISKIVNEKSV